MIKAFLIGIVVCVLGLAISMISRGTEPLNSIGLTISVAGALVSGIVLAFVIFLILILAVTVLVILIGSSLRTALGLR